MREIFVTIDENGRAVKQCESLGYSGEHRAVRLNIDIANAGSNFHYNHARIVVNGRYSDELLIYDGIVNYVVPQECMVPPKAKCQVVFYNLVDGVPVVIVKTEVFQFTVEPSQVAREQMTEEPGYFEKAMEKCEYLYKQSELEAEKAKEHRMFAASAASEAVANAEASAAAVLSIERSVVSVKSSEEKVEAIAREIEETVNGNTLANALKRTASGNIVEVSDVSPVPHDIILTVEGEIVGSELTKTVNLTESVRSFELDTIADSVRLDMWGNTRCIGAVVPIIDGNPLPESTAIIPMTYFGETTSTVDVIYKIENGVLTWSGILYPFGLPDHIKDISGSYDLSEMGSNPKIVGFNQIYTVDESNPYYTGHVDDNVNIRVNVYEGGYIKYKDWGKNFFDVSKIPTTITITNNGDGSITLGGSKYNHNTNTMLKTLCPQLKVGMTVTLNAVTDGANIIYLSEPYGKSWTFGTSKEVTEDMLNSYVYLYGVQSGEEGYENPQNICNIQLELGTSATEYEPYKEPTIHIMYDGREVIPSSNGNMTIEAVDENVTLTVEYNRDINKAFAELQKAIISLGGNV